MKGLKRTLNDLFESIWKNINGLYFIENTQIYNSCKDAYTYLQICWEFNILSVIFLCQDMNSKIFLYTFNPYNSYAPKIWKMVYSLKQKNGHPFRIFNHEYNIKGKEYILVKYMQSLSYCNHINISILFITFFNFLELPLVCKHYNFEKTSTLSGFPIRLAGEEMFYDPYLKAGNEFNIEDGVIAKELFHYLNASLNIIGVSEDFIIYQNGSPNHILADLLYGKYDMKFSFDFGRLYWANEFNTFLRATVCYITTKEKVTMFEQFISVFATENMIFLIVVNLMIFITFALTQKRDLSAVVIDFFRIIVGVATLKKPKRLLQRIIFLFIILLCSISGFYLQSRWYSSLTSKPIHTRDIKSLLDLARYEYKINTINYHLQYMSNFSHYENVSVIGDFKECVELLVNDPKAACAGDCAMLKEHFYDGHKVRISEDHTFEPYNVYLFRNDFPLYERIRQVYNRMFGSGIVLHILSIIVHKYYKKNEDNTFEKAKSIELSQLQFAFYFILFANGFAIVIFLTELLIKRILKGRK